MKIVKFRHNLIESVLNGTKTSTWRLFDDKDLKVGDVITLQDWESEEKIGEAEITAVREKRLKELDENDFEGHEKYENEEAMLQGFRLFYGDRVTRDTKVKMIDFKVIPSQEPRKKYNKLVRDKIPDIIRSKGEFPSLHIAAKPEYWEKLKEKLSEEVEEFKSDESLGELADILEVLDAIIYYKKFSVEEMRKAKEKKAEERGTFRGRIILDEA
jgi:predicted house-cleaning noncanonical NTP pyrophosphatase (MazG superfamily)/uncharacterized protein YqfB (UPF0267 family)